MGREQKWSKRQRSHSSSTNGIAAPTRRHALSTIAAFGLISMLGCARFASGSDLNELVSDLDAVLARAPDGTTAELAEISLQIQSDAQALISSQDAFSTGFDQLSSDPNVSDRILWQWIEEYENERRAKRESLLNLQGQLFASVPEDLWPDVLEVLSRKAHLVSAKTGMRKA